MKRRLLEVQHFVAGFIPTGAAYVSSGFAVESEPPALAAI
jgi:hypothetical protein